MQQEDSDEEDDDVSIVHDDDRTRGASPEGAMEEVEIGSDDLSERGGVESEGGEPQMQEFLGKSAAAEVGGGGPQLEGSLGQSVGMEAREGEAQTGEAQTGGSLGRVLSKGLEGWDGLTGVEGGVKGGRGGLLQVRLTPDTETEQDRVPFNLQPRKLLFAEEDSSINEPVGASLLQRSGGIEGGVRQPSSTALPVSLTPGSGGAEDDSLDDGDGERELWHSISYSMVKKWAHIDTGGAELLGSTCRDSVLDERSGGGPGESSHENQAPDEMPNNSETPVSEQSGGEKSSLFKGTLSRDPLEKEAEPPLKTDRDVESVGNLQDTAAKILDTEERPSQKQERQREEEERAIQRDHEVRETDEGLRELDDEAEEVDGKMRLSDGRVHVLDSSVRISAARAQELEEEKRRLKEKVRELETLVRTSEAKACEMERKCNEAESRARAMEERALRVEGGASKADARASERENWLHKKEEDVEVEVSKLDEKWRRLHEGVGFILWDQKELAQSYRSGVSETDIAQGMVESVTALAELLQELEGAKEGLAEGLGGRGGLIKRAKEHLVDLRGDLKRSKEEGDSLRRKLEATEKARGEAEKKARELEGKIRLAPRLEPTADGKGLVMMTTCKLSRAECAEADCVVGGGGSNDVICERAGRSESGFHELRAELEDIRRDYAELKSMAEREAEEHRKARENCKKLTADMAEVRDRVKRLAEHCNRLKESQKANREEKCSARP
jgi:DNA repair exonuclease SbcCD ATPase subunit